MGLELPKEKDFVLACIPYDENAVDEAVKYCKDNGLTPNDARIVKIKEKNSENYEFVLVKRK